MLINLLLSSNLSWSLVISYLIAALINIFVSLPIHECAHGFVAHKLGDNTAKYQGRLTLNPLAHIDYIGAAMILLVGFGWAKPVQVDMRRFKNPKAGMAITALAGPVSNLLLATISLLFGNLALLMANTYLISAYSALTIVGSVLYFVAEINVYLAVFNLIPIPPLDGSRILNAFLPDRIYYQLMRYERYSFVIIFGLVYLFGNYLGSFTDCIVSALSWITWLPLSFL